jgi:hypothetical protein
LRRVSYPAGAQLGLEGGSGAVRVAIDRGPSAAEVEFGGDVSTSLGGGPRQSRHVEVTEWLRLVSDKAPVELWLGRAEGHSLQWRGLQPQAVRFVERQAGADGQARLVSSLVGGEMRLPATDRLVELATGSGLVLEGLRLDRAELVLGDRVTLMASGSASRMELETAGVRRSLAPSLLEYLARNHTLGLLWSAAGLLWGMVTWLRKTLDDKAA